MLKKIDKLFHLMELYYICNKMVDKIKILNDYLILKNANAVSKLHNCACSTVCRILKKNNIAVSMRHSKQKYKINENFFEIIDSEEKSYWLGFLYADGYIHKPSHQIKLSLLNKDEDHLNKYLISLSSNLPIKIRIRKDLTSFREVSIYNVKMMNDLLNLGCTQAKTHTLMFPKFLNKDLIRHFVRGYFDGDGCITTSNNLPQFTIVGNETFLLLLQQNLIDSINYNKTKFSIRHKERNNNIRIMSYGGINNVIKMAEYLYLGASIYMTRKKDKFISIFNTYNSQLDTNKNKKTKEKINLILNEIE